MISTRRTLVPLAVMLCVGAGARGAVARAQQSPPTATTASVSTVDRMVNRFRRRHGLAPLRVDVSLAHAADRHARDMVERHYFSHTTPSGRSFVSWVARSGYLRRASGWCLGEVLAWDSAPRTTPAVIVHAWMASPPHRAILLEPAYRQLGIAITRGVPSSGGGGYTYAIDFGRLGAAC
jgi:uncharacterized protein YkwD